jgi:hypothetical protein
MLTAESVQEIKQNNVSANGDLTKQRAKEVLKTATQAQKNEIEALAGLKRVSIQRVYATGNISAKIAVAIAQTLGLNPFYLTGEADESGECTDKVIGDFLKAKGYDDLAKKAAKPPRKPRGTAVTKEENVEKLSAPAEPMPNDVESLEPTKVQKNDDLRPHWELTEEEAVQLLRALYLQAQFSTSIKDTLEQIQTLLV